MDEIYTGDRGEEHLNSRPGGIDAGAAGGVSPETDVLAPLSGEEVGANLWLYSDGAIWDMGPAEVDSDGDGRRDSLTSGGEGTVTIYTDSDHDGGIDRVARIDDHGNCVTVGLDAATGTWHPDGFGRLG